eukprot:6134471-Amphidinium_carterae.2
MIEFISSLETVATRFKIPHEWLSPLAPLERLSIAEVGALVKTLSIVPVKLTATPVPGTGGTVADVRPALLPPTCACRPPSEVVAVLVSGPDVQQCVHNSDPTELQQLGKTYCSRH